MIIGHNGPRWGNHLLVIWGMSYAMMSPENLCYTKRSAFGIEDRNQQVALATFASLGMG